MAGDVRNALRLLRVARILARHDAFFLLDTLDIAPGLNTVAHLFRKRGVTGRPGERLARALQEIGPSFIKLGQALSTRSDLLGEDVCRDLSCLQDNLPPFTGIQAQKTIRAELGASTDALFSCFDDAAHAAASIAQVHFATTTDGRDVAVKILRPGIEKAFRRDLKLFRWIAEKTERDAPQFRRLKPRRFVAVLERTIMMEMDLRFEAAAAAEMSESFKDDTTFHVPQVEWALSGQRVLTTNRITGISLDDREAIIAAGHDPLDVLDKAAGAFFQQVFRDGFFHADLHPGNLFVREDGSVGAVDFGIMGRLTMADRRYLGGILLGFLSRDFHSVSQLHHGAGWIPSGKSVDDFAHACRAIAEPILDKPQNEISIARLLGLLFQIARTFEMETQPQLLLLQKTMLVAEGTARSLAPEANIWFMARPRIEAWVQENMGPQARLQEAAQETTDTLSRLPNIVKNLDEASERWARGEIRLDEETIAALKENPSVLSSPRILWGIIAALVLLVGSLL